MSSPDIETKPQPEKRRSGLSTEWSLRLDAALLGLFLGLSYVVAVEFQVFEELYELSQQQANWQVDRIVTAVLISFFGLTIFAVRRTRDQQKEIAQRKAAEKELLAYQENLQRMVDEATTQLRIKAAETERALVREQQLNELQRQFVSLASHEFRTPLAIIDATAQRIEGRVNKITPEQLTERTREIRTAVERMTQLMESTLATARLDAGELSIETGPCDIRGLVSEVCSSYQSIAESHVISCDISNLPDLIQADSNAVRQALTNLVSNAVKYSPGSRDIQVTAFTDGDDVKIEVRDRGLGIPEDDLPRMFTRFFRANTSTGIAGTGLGLHLVKTLAEMHGGSISVASEEGKGSAFTLRLPVRGPAETGATESQAA